jgi:hypothetical protein
MPLPEWLLRVLPGDTAHAWEVLAEILPDHAYLGGGTAVATHLQHRMSEDLDVFFEHTPDLDHLADELERRGPTVVSRNEGGTLDCRFATTKVQLLDAAHCHLIEEPIDVSGLRVAGLGDLMGMKLRAITDRGIHRDYFDLAAMEMNGGRSVEEGMAYFDARFEPKNPDEAVANALRALSYLGDIEEDPAIPVSVAELQGYWQRRLPGITSHLNRYGHVYPDSVTEAHIDAVVLEQHQAVKAAQSAGLVGPHRSPAGKCAALTKKRRRCPFDAQAGSKRCGIHRSR